MNDWIISIQNSRSIYISMRIFTILLLFSLSIYSKGIFDEVTSQLTSQIKKVTLENGLTLIMMKRSESPTLALYIKFKVGSVDETPDIAGTAHLLEHMMFKGTKTIGTKDYAQEEKFQEQIKIIGSQRDKLRLQSREYTKNGFDIPHELNNQIEVLSTKLKALETEQKKFIIKSEDSFIYTQNGQVGFNAYTTNDVTNYQIQLPSNRLELWAKIESDRLKNPILREYYTERDVIMEERRMRVENRGVGMLREKFIGTAFEEHPYRKPVIGYASNIPFLDIYETENFFKKYYAPNNMVISIVGDQDFIETEAIIRKYFSDLVPSPKENTIRTMEKMNSGEKRVSIRYPHGPVLLMGWHKPSVPTKDNSVFEVLDVILTGGADSRLFKRLVLKEKLVQSIEAWNGDPGERYSNLFSIYSNANSDGDMKKIEDIIWEEIEILKKKGVSEQEISKVKNKLIADFFRGIDNNSTLADMLSYYELITGDWANLFKSYEMLNSVTNEDIKRVAENFLTRENVTIGTLIDSRNTK